VYPPVQISVVTHTLGIVYPLVHIPWQGKCTRGYRVHDP